MSCASSDVVSKTIEIAQRLFAPGFKQPRHAGDSNCRPRALSVASFMLMGVSMSTVFIDAISRSFNAAATTRRAARLREASHGAR